MFDWFKKNDIDFKFAEVSDGVVYPHYPPILAKDLKPLKEHQEKKYGEYKFPGCPGMHDYARLGYIIPAWSNLHIKANKAGFIGIAGSLGEESQRRGTNIKQPQFMDNTIVDGLFELKDGVSPQILNFPAPWKIHSTKNISCLVLPAFYHSNFLDDLYVYPGVVDYKGFVTINFICAPKRPCEVKITAGDPLLHVIPFITNKDIVAAYGPATKEEEDHGKVLKWYHETNFYRRYYMIRKKFKLVKDV
jgi:hypothetical protein